MICCIIQPTFMPWLGFFALIDQCDKAILLDSVAFSKQSWQQRNRIRTSKGLEFVTVPVKTAGRLGQEIRYVEIVENGFIRSIEGRIRHHYRDAPFFQQYFPIIFEVIKTNAKDKNLAQLNIAIIRMFVDILGIKTTLSLSSSLNIKADRSTLLVDICKYNSCNSYLSPQGSREYLEEDRGIFESNGISVSLQSFTHPTHHQMFQPFIPFASVLDLILNEGPRSLEIIRSGIGHPQSLIL
jgi:hypothetical protein